MVFDSYPYDRVAAIYDELADLYSIGRIGMSKRFALDAISPGDDVLFAGVGRGAEAVQAAALGGRVHAVDLSSEMLRRFSEQVDRAGLDAVARVGDVSLHDPSETYDVVVANYFLNLFDAKRAGEMLGVLVRCLRPEGRLVIADFECPSSHFSSRLISALYYRPVNVVAWLLGFCALHPILDYSLLLAAHGMRIRKVERFPLSARLGKIGPAYVSIVAERQA